MAVPTIERFEIVEVDHVDGANDVALSATLRTAAADGDVLVMAGGGDKFHATVIDPEDGTAYGSADWVATTYVIQSSTGASFINYIVLTDESALPTTVSVELGADRPCVFGIYLLRGVDTGNIEPWTTASSSDPSWAEDSDLNSGAGTSNDDNMVLSVTGNTAADGSVYEDDPTTLTVGSWTEDGQGYHDGGSKPDAFAAFGHIEQASAGTLAKQDLHVDNTSDACCTMAFPGAASAATGTMEAAAEVSGVPTQTHEQTATLEAGAEASATATQTHEATATTEAAAEASATAKQIHELSGTVEAAAEATATATQTHEQAATLEAAAEVSGAPSVSGIVELSGTVEAAAEVSGTPSVLGLIELTGTIEAAAEASGVATQTHNATATIEAAAESTATATQIHVQAGTAEVAAETTAAATLIYELTGSAEAAAESSGTPTQTHNATAVLEAAAEASGVATQTHNAAAVLEAAAEVVGTLTATTAATKGFVVLTDETVTGLALSDTKQPTGYRDAYSDIYGDPALDVSLTEEPATGLVLVDS